MRRFAENVISFQIFIQTLRNRLLILFRSDTCILGLIIALAFCLRTYKLQEVPAGIFFDEITGTYDPFLFIHGLVGLSLKNIISYLLSGTFFTYLVAGPSPFFTRLPADLIGTLLVLVVYLLAKEIFSKKVGLFSVLLTAFCHWEFIFSNFQALISS